MQITFTVLQLVGKNDKKEETKMYSTDRNNQGGVGGSKDRTAFFMMSLRLPRRSRDDNTITLPRLRLRVKSISSFFVVPQKHPSLIQSIDHSDRIFNTNSGE